MCNLKGTYNGINTSSLMVTIGTALFKKIVTKKFDFTLLIQM